MITHDRWPRIKEIFHSALDHAPAERSVFLNQVCGNDAALREEVETLLIADAETENFLTQPAYEFAAGMLADEPSEFAPGQEVGQYQIECFLSSGGMGQIYEAHDTKLGRKIALKFISPEYAKDPHRVQRFEQEARAASALNHPNVCVIHDIGVTDNGRHFIAMEFIVGPTLRDELVRRTFTTLEAVEITIQVGDALASAHAKGIVHRDIKPENIMLRPDGYVKVVDFGLAKLTELLSERRHIGEPETKINTESHMIMGTVRYMSPEQLREAPVDERTDIWSLGVVLYEMLIGATPFKARAPNESIALILSSQPQLHEEIPVQLREIIKKALEKDCTQRYQTITEFTADLRRLKRELEINAEADFLPFGEFQFSSDLDHRKEELPKTGSEIFTRFKSQAILTADFLFTEIRTHKKAAMFAGATGVFAFLFIAQEIINKKVDPVPQPPSSSPAAVYVPPLMKQLTNFGGSVCAATSSDGKLVVHAEERKGKQSLIVTDTTTTAFGSTVVVPPAEVKYLGVSFSRDSNFVYFTRQEKSGPGILYRLALQDKDVTRLNTGVDGPISFSPLGDRFAFVRYDPETTVSFLMLSDANGTNEQIVAIRKKPEMFSVYGVAWSPDGSKLVCPTGYWDTGFQMNLVAFDLNTRSEQKIGDRSWFSVYGVAWQHDSLVISARERATSPFHLWRIPLSDGTAQPLTSDVAEYRGVSLAGDTIVTVKINLSWELWVSSLDGSQQTPIAKGSGLNYGLSWTRDGKIVYSSMGPDRLNIFQIDPDGSNQVRLTNNAEDNYMPAASVDGRFIVFVSNRSGAFEIWRMNADGSDPKQLTFSKGNFYPFCSPDNKWVVYDNQLTPVISIWKVPLEGGEPLKVADKYRMPVFSPDSQFIAARFDLESGSYDGAIFSAQGDQPLRTFPIPLQEWQRLEWLSNRELSYVKNVNGYSNIWSYDLFSTEMKRLTNFKSELIYAYSLSPETKQVASQRATKLSDVMLIRSER